MIKLFVFDLGNVILPFEHRQIAVKLHETSRIQDRFTPDDLFKFLFDRDRGLVNPYEEGLMSSVDFFAKLRETRTVLVDQSRGGVHSPLSFLDLGHPLRTPLRRERGCEGAGHRRGAAR